MSERISPEERKLIERFETAFNRTERAMQAQVRQPNLDYPALLRWMLTKRRLLLDQYNFLDGCRNLRNYIVHYAYEVDIYMAVPRLHIIERIETLATRLENPPTVYSYFSKSVEIVKVSDTMYRVMKLIHDFKYTHFPVYDDNKDFVNLLTETVVTFWLAKHAVTKQEMGFADLRDTVGDALELQDEDAHWEFIPRNMTMTEATIYFAENPVLEALIITENGKITETPIGIVTRSDALDMLDGKRDTQQHRQVK